jgi:alkylation response protein AidB-like acyl-CoA dehydrogenase
MNDLLKILAEVEARADHLDETGAWPEQDLRALTGIGAMGWAVPTEFGGEGCTSLELHLRYETIASASLTVALILSQRDSGLGVLVDALDHPRRGELLTKLARGELFTTRGIAQLTTSRQRGAPAVRATRIDGGYEIDGEIPWATGAAWCDFISAGAALEDRRQMLFMLPTDLAGVRVQPSMPLVALRASHTTSVRCDRVRIADEHVLVPPAEHALASRRPTVPIGQAFMAMGLARGALHLIERIDSPSARSAHQRLGERLALLRADVIGYCQPDAVREPDRGTHLRGQVIDLSLRSTHAAVSLYKGTGLLAGHPAQRLAREAMFLLVWSCPAPVLDCTLDLLTQQEQRDDG